VAADNRGRLGLQGEQQAARFLKKRGHTVLASRFRTRLGELDLVTRSGEHLYFVEVKTRSSSESKARFGGALEAVDHRKQRRISKLAELFIDRHKLWDLCPHFAVIGIESAQEGSKIRFLPDAFDAC